MDFSYVTGAAASLKAAKDIGSALLEIRDFNKSATQLAQLNDLLLKAQDSLFAHNAQLLQLQSDHFEASKKLRELEEALAERGRYTLVELGEGTFAYKANLIPAQGAAGQPVTSEPEHYICQPCFDKGTRSVLQRHYKFGSIHGRCPVCDNTFDTGGTYEMVF